MRNCTPATTQKKLLQLFSVALFFLFVSSILQNSTSLPPSSTSSSSSTSYTQTILPCLSSDSFVHPIITSTLLSHFPNPPPPTPILPSWITKFCPEVIAHYTKFPYFDNFSLNDHDKATKLQLDTYGEMGKSTTEYAIKSTCMIKIFQALSEKVSATPFIYAGAHLGAILHAGLIPWDDDVDLAVDFKYKGALMSECEKFQHTNLDVQITCVERYNAVKLSVLAPEDDKMSFPHGKYISPYLDIYFISEDEHFVYELSPKGEKQHQVSERSGGVFSRRESYNGGNF